VKDNQSITMQMTDADTCVSMSVSKLHTLLIQQHKIICHTVIYLQFW